MRQLKEYQPPEFRLTEQFSSTLGSCSATSQRIICLSTYSPDAFSLFRALRCTSRPSTAQTRLIATVHVFPWIRVTPNTFQIKAADPNEIYCTFCAFQRLFLWDKPFVISLTDAVLYEKFRKWARTYINSITYFFKWYKNTNKLFFLDKRTRVHSYPYIQ